MIFKLDSKDTPVGVTRLVPDFALVRGEICVKPIPSHSPRISHRNQLTVKVWEKAVQE